MTADTLRTDSAVRPTFPAPLTGAKGRGKRRAWAACMCLVAVLAQAGCKNSKDSSVGGSGVSRPKDKNDPLVHGPTRIPKQDLPVPDRATGPKGKFDPLTTPTGGKSAGYTDDPERFKGTFIPGKSSTPASLASRTKDDDELKIADTGGVPLTPAGGTLPGGSLEPPADVEPLFAQLDKLGVKRADRFLERENGQWTFRASLPLNSEGARRQYTGVAPTAAEAVKQVLTQLSTAK